MAWAEKMPSGRWRGCWRDMSKKKQYITNEGKGYERKTDAREAAQEQEVKARRTAAVESGTQSARMTWRQWRAIIDEKRLIHAASNTRKTEQMVINRYVMPRWGDVPLNQITHRLVQAWVTDDLVPGKKPSYVRTIYSSFQMTITTAVEKEVLLASPCAGVKLPSPKKKVVKPYMTVRDRDNLLPHLKPAYQRMVKYQLHTGLRPGELCGLHADQLDFDSGWVDVTNTYVEGRDLIRAYPKDEEQRSVPLTNLAIEAAREALAGRDLRGGCGVPHADGSRCRSVLVFLSPTGLRPTPRSYARSLSRAADQAECRRRSPYAVRRGFGTLCAEAGVDAFTIAAWMGHENLKETNGYVQRTSAARAKFLAFLGEAPGLSIVGQSEGHGARSGAELHGMASEGLGPFQARMGT